MQKANQWTRFQALAVCGVGLVAGWQVYARSIVPLKAQATEARRGTSELKGLIAGAQKTIAEVRAWEQRAGGADGGPRSPEGDIPSGSPLVWFPARMKKHFENAGLAGVVTRLNTTLVEPERPALERTYWIVQLPLESSSAGFRKACLAVTDLEPVNPSVRVLDVEIRKDADDPTQRVMVMNVSVLARKADR